ncbi:MAG TPA: ABC transporter permease [Vicinamibacterales bacterium]|nr:ABC transporter permease [Vicinamibacterales bacterium]
MPDWHAIVRARIGAIPVDPARESDIFDELAQHVAEHYADLVANGTPEDRAMDAALAPLADRARVRLAIARADRPRPSTPTPPAHGTSLIADLSADVRYAIRLLRRSPAFTAVALLTLAIGVGVNTATFSVLHAVLLRPLPFAQPSRLVMLGERAASGHASQVGYATFVDWKARTRSFDDLAIVRDWSATIAAAGEPRRVSGLRVSANYFRLLGVRPAIGRDFTAAEDDPAHWRVLILSDALWRRQFGADPSVVGRVVNIGDRDYTVVGVMPSGFDDLIGAHYYRPVEAWSHLGYDTSLSYACRTCQHLRGVGRLRAGATVASAASDLHQLHEQLRREHPADYPLQSDVTVEPLRSGIAGDVSGALALLMGAVALVLLIACANVANLLLARMGARAADLGLRAALGAGRSRIVRQLMTENAVIALAGGLGGVALTAAAMSGMTALAPEAVTRIARFRVDAPVLAFSAVVSMATAMVFGLLPALRAARVDLRSTIHGGGRIAGSGRAARLLLVGGEVALAVVLLIGAALTLQSVGRLLRVDPGFSSDGVLTLRTAMLGSAYATPEPVVAKTAQMLDRIRAVPGVASAAAASQVPLGGDGDRFGFHIQERPSSNPADDSSVERYGVTPDYFDVMRIPLLRGRLFTDADRSTAEMALIVSQHTARALFAGDDPLGKHVKIGGLEGPWHTIVGVVGDVRHADVGAGTDLEMYTCQWQVADSFLTIVVRGETAVPGDVTRALRSAAPDLPIYDVAPLRELLARSIAPQRFVMTLLAIFGAIALLLTAVGVYGVIASTIAERTREIGIRMALGAGPARVVRTVAGEGCAVVAAGVAAGLLLAGAAASWLRHDLYGISPTDPATLAFIALTVAAVAALAHAAPVLRAVRVDPSMALRHD